MSRNTANPVGWSSTSIARIFISLFDITKPANFVVQNVKPDNVLNVMDNSSICHALTLCFVGQCLDLRFVDCSAPETPKNEDNPLKAKRK